jgi:hypothetical protein
LLLLACAPTRIAALPPAPITAVAARAQDTAPKEQPRLLPAEAYLRSYLTLLGNPLPIEAQKMLRGNDGGSLFDNWADYLSTLGFPDYRNDLPRATQTNGLMMAAFERLGVALCDRSLERDAKSPSEKRALFAFDFAAPDEAAFAARFDVLHRAILGYPLNLAPKERNKSFFALYQGVVKRHAGMKSRFTPDQAGWAAVCYALIRHPEYQLY